MSWLLFTLFCQFSLVQIARHAFAEALGTHLVILALLPKREGVVVVGSLLVELVRYFSTYR